MQLDKELLKLCLKEDRKAQFQLYRTCFSTLMRICARYEKNKEDATALLNMGFLKICNNLDKYSLKIPFEAWIRRIMINTIIDEYRKNKERLERTEYVDFQDGYGYASNFVDFNEADLAFDARELRDMIEALPPVSKKVFNLYVVDGYSHKEIAAMLEISEATSRWHLSNSRTIIKQRIQEQLNPVQAIAL